MSRPNALSVLNTAREDEWELDFNDSRQFLIEQFKNANNIWPLSRADREQSDEVTDHTQFSEYVYREKTVAQRANKVLKSTALLGLTQFDKWLWKFDDLIKDLVVDSDSETDQELIEVKSIDTSNLWRLAYLNVKVPSTLVYFADRTTTADKIQLSIDSDVKLKAMQRWTKELQRNLELLVNSIRGQMDNKTNEINNIRTELTETFEPLISLLKTSVDYLQRNYDDKDFSANWKSGMETRRADTYESMASTIRHLRDVTTNNRVNQSQEPRYAAEGLRTRTEQLDGDEKAVFPLDTLPPLRADHFTGRDKDLENIHEWLGLQETPAIRTYTIYGRRGIGKTQIALEYARKHRKHYDAIFWVQAETKGALRQSFTDIALALELPGADKNSTFDENLMRVLRWLRHTRKRWLLIYDNAEREQLLKGYWPTGGHGAMLLTSRSYYNFFEDDQRRGETVQLFTDTERRQLFLACLGEDWQSSHLNTEDMMVEIEDAAISALLKKTGGLPIAIRHAATLIVDKDVNSTLTARSFMEKFNDAYQSLPRRQISERDPLVRALDTIWSIAFSNLQAPAKNILSGLSLLAPDRILIDLFLPSDQNLLTHKLEFCRTASHNTNLIKAGPGTSLQTVINPSPKLLDAINELFVKNLIKKTGRDISIHRTVQEAVSYQGKDDLIDFFDAMVSVLYDAFPKQDLGRPLTDYWANCQLWIQHVVTLALRYKAYTSNRPEGDIPLKGMASAELFVQLLANASWYLFEIADYEEALNLIEIASTAAEDKNSLDYAHLLNTAGVTFYELNKLRRAREALERCLAIRTSLLPEGHIEIANTLSNLGNVETAENNLEAAMEVLEKSAVYRESLGDEAAMMLALSYLQIGRVLFLREDYPQSYAMYQKCEGVLNKKVGRNRLFTANLHYAYGNLEFAQQQYEQAAKSFEITRQISSDFNPMHPLTAAACYKLACTEFEQDHHKKALNYLSKALDIAELRGTMEVDGMDGTVVRILFKRAEVLLDDPLGDRTEGTQLMNDMLFRQKDVAEKLEVDLRGFDALDDREKGFDLLVPGYFR
ncbi:hypothetical protein H2200_000961 [Cladophialophora chaetospira]|uniref:NB-ARC domain-containing protein n=1 Tax=Cladophialophora chaetospira TaxID=386627 RepID=A0AA38XPF6_9EURO|nr:hypothetical protein H2200_000961 [Cladophialophora chaetospira]